MDQYEELGCIGEGTYGVVIKCRHRETGQLVAIKQFKESDDDEQVRKTVEREVRVLKALAHVNIVSLLDVFQARGRVCLVFEYVERTVLDCLKLQPRGLGDAATRRIMWQLVTAVKYLHSQKVPLMHRDIKPENMLVSGEGLLKLCDFGFARPCVGAGARAELSDYVATRWYRSPELLVGDRSYGPAVDVWAIGCMAVEMHTGDPLFPGESDVDQLWLILKGMGSLTPGHTHLLSRNPYFTGMRQPAAWEMEPLEVRYRKFDLPLLQFLKACLHPNPEKRASCSELLRLPYLANVEASFSDDFLAAEAEARERLEQRAAAAKLRKHKRKSADLEPPQKSATFSITASAHVSIPDAPRYRPAPPLRLEPQEEAEAPQMTRPESPRAEARCAPVAQAASPDSRASRLQQGQNTTNCIVWSYDSSPPEPPSSGPAPMELMSPAGHGGCRSPAHKLAAAAEPAPRAGRGVGHGYPLCVSGVQSTLFRATPPRKQAGAGRGESPQPCPDAAAAQQPALRRSRRKPVATRLF
ncbi:hypothetical protein WJX75_009925 [Coccomyxa subellipsoidea]|uniref:Protein kinase domain-containing protein n=1 Tax=Coccomyxa subellipsoidea TaxID=248742 RepID=A0ABR2YZB4_9CHLO